MKPISLCMLFFFSSYCVLAGAPLLQAYRGPSLAKAFSPDGRLLATASKGTQVWDTQNGELVFDLPGKGRLVTALSFSHDGSLLAAGGTDLILVWDMVSGRVLHRFTCCAATNLAFGPEGRFLFSAGEVNRWRRWDLTSGKGDIMGQMTELPLWLIFAPDGRTVAARFLDKVQLLEPQSGKFLRTIETKANGTLVFSPNSQVMGICEKGKVYRWRQPGGQPQGILILPEGGPIGKIAFSNNGRFMAFLDKVGYRVLDNDSGKVLFTFARNDGTAQPIFSPDGKMLVLSGEDMVWWSTETGKQIRLFPRLFLGEGKLAFSQDGSSLVYRGNGGSWDWDLATCTPHQAKQEKGQGSLSSTRIVSSDKRLQARGLERGKTLELVEVATGKKLRELKLEKPLISATFSEDGLLLAASCRDGEVLVWETKSGNRFQISARFDCCRRLGFAPGSVILAMVTDKITLVDWRANKVLRVLEGSGGKIQAPVFSADGKLVAASMLYEGLQLWRVADGKHLKTLPAFGRALCFSPDSRQIAADTGDGIIRLWDLHSWASVTLLTLADDSWLAWTHEGYFHGSPEGRQRLSWRRDGELFREAALQAQYYRPGRVSLPWEGRK